MKPELQTDLDWLAFQYVACELTEPDSLAFEARLADDQLAREAVARAVELTQTLSAAGELNEIVVRSADLPVPAAVARTAWSVPLAWMSVGAAACLVLVLVLSVAPGVPRLTHSQRRETAIRSNPKTLELARVWSGVRRDQATVDVLHWDREHMDHEQIGRVESRASVQESADDDLDNSELEGVELADELAAVPMPSWMLSAVATELGSESPSESREN